MVDSGRLKSARLVTSIIHVKELICSQEGQSGQHLSICEIAAELNISDRSVWHIAKKDRFQKVLSASINQKQLERATALLLQLKVCDMKRVFFTDVQPEQQSLGGCQESCRLAACDVYAGVCFGDKGRLPLC